MSEINSNMSENAAAARRFRRQLNRSVGETISLLAGVGEFVDDREDDLHVNGAGQESAVDEHRDAGLCEPGQPSRRNGASTAESHALESLQRLLVKPANDGENPEDRLRGFRRQLQEWAINNFVPHTVVTALLAVLRGHSCFSALPSSARALLETPRKSPGIRNMGSGKYCPFGLAAGLEELLRGISRLPEHLILNFNVDGLPLGKSSRNQFWPILCEVRNVQNVAPFIVGLFYGQSKPPDANDFLHDFVQELSELLQEGVCINGTKIALRVGAFICDAPAKSFILCIKGHTGYYSCTKCTVRGTYINGRVCFPDLTASLRTDADFRSMSQEEHHLDTGPSILLELPVDVVKQCREPQFRKVTTPKFMLKRGKRDSCCVLSDESQGSTMMHGPMGHKRNEEASSESQGSTMMHRAMGHKRNEEAFTGLDKQVIRILHTIRLRVEQHSMQLDTILGILNSSGAMNVPNDEILEEPFDNVDDFLVFDKKLKTCKATKESLVNQLAAVGGSSVGNNTRGVLEQLMTQKVAVKFSWLGQREKMKFKDLEYPDVIYRAVKKNKRLETDKAEVWEVIKTWLKHAAEKLKKEQRKLQPDE
ncbi:uncharacterized protein ISCGN_016155 [Ixodes scapularis]